MARNLSYARLDVDLFDNRKFIWLLGQPGGRDALIAWLRLTLWARKNADPEKPGDAGTIDQSIARHVLGDKHDKEIALLTAARLLDCPLSDGEWDLHDFAEHQDLAGWARRQAKAKRATSARWSPPSDAPGNAPGNAPGSPTGNAITQPNPIEPPNGGSGGRATRLPRNWEPSRDLLRWAAQTLPDVNAAWETDKFRDYWWGKSGKDATKIDWDATWKNWLRKAAEDGNGPPRRSGGGGREQIEGDGWR